MGDKAKKKAFAHNKPKPFYALAMTVSTTKTSKTLFFMKQYLFSFLLAVVALACSTANASAQGSKAPASSSSSSYSEIWDRVQKAVVGESQQKTYQNPKNKAKVSVTVKDLDWSDITKSGASLREAFKSGFGSPNSLEIKDISFGPDFQNGAYFLSFSLPEEETTKIVILDVAGNEILNEEIEDFTGTYESKVNIPAAAKGTYFLKIVQGFNLVNKKLVIE